MFNGCCLLPRLQFNKYRDFSALCIMIEIMSITDLELSNAFKTDVYFFVCRRCLVLTTYYYAEDLFDIIREIMNRIRCGTLAFSFTNSLNKKKQMKKTKIMQEKKTEKSKIRIVVNGTVLRVVRVCVCVLEQIYAKHYEWC